VPKPLDIKKWEEGKCYLLLDKTVPRLKADRMLQDLSCIALKHAQSSVQQRLTLRPNSRGENRAPIVFQKYDKEGEYLAWALLLREALPSPSAASEDFDSDSDSSIPRVDAGAPPTPHPRFLPTEGRQEGDNRHRQQDMLDAWMIEDPETPIGEEQRYTLELYAQLTDDELVYVTELQRCFGDTCCYFFQWILSAETKELVNSARISALQLGTGFTWANTRAEILRSLTDVTLSARFLVLSKLKRKSGAPAKLWVSQVLTRKALLLQHLIILSYCTIVILY
jgi:hypothetical protein